MDTAKQGATPGRVAAGIALLVFGFFAPTLGYDFLHSDDDVNVFDNEHIRSLNLESIRWMFSDFEQAVRFKPLSWLGWAIVYQFSGLDPLGYHLANVALHAVNAALLFWLLLQLRAGASSMALAGLCALCWGLHPLRVEPVAWVTGFPYHLTTFFLLLSVLSYLRVERARPAFRQGWFWGSVSCYVLGVATYPIALGFVFVLLALDLIKLQPQAGLNVRSLTEALVEKAPFLIVAAAVTALTVINRYRVESVWGSASAVNEYDYARHFLQACYVWVYYLWKPVFALHQTATPMDLIENETWSPPFLLSVVVLATVSIVCLAKIRSRPGLAAFWIAHLGLLAPLLGVTEDYHFPSDRYAMLPGLIMAAALYLWLARLDGQQRVIPILSVALVVYAVQSIRYLPVWRDDVQYFGYLSVRLEENIMRPAMRDRLGDAYLRRDEIESAIGSYRGAIAGNSPFTPPSTYFKLATLLEATQRFARSEQVLRQGLARQPDNAGGIYLLAKLMARRDQRSEAITLLRGVLKTQPNFTEARALLDSLTR